MSTQMWLRIYRFLGERQFALVVHGDRAGLTPAEFHRYRRICTLLLVAEDRLLREVVHDSK
jgi:hypothetical protein